MNRKRFGAESNVIDRIESNRQEAGPVEPRTQKVMLQTHGLDMYGRTLADVPLPDGMNVNTRSLKTADAGGIGSMRRRIWCWKG